MPTRAKITVVSAFLLRQKLRPCREYSTRPGSMYDTSGPYSDPTASIEFRRGLPDLRGPWLDARGDTESYEGRQRARWTTA